MRQIVDDEHFRIYGIVTRYIELVTVRRLLLLVDDVPCDDAVDAKVFVIDDLTHSTMLLAEEY